MPVTINGTTGIVGPDGSAASPALTGADANTGVFFPAADTVALTANGSAKFTANSNGTLDVDTWKGNLSRDWDNYPTISVINNTAYGPQTEFRIQGVTGPSCGDFSVNLRVDGVFISGGQTLAYNVSDATAVTVNTATPTTIASCTITTTGKPVLLVSTGDGNPNQSGGWHYLQIYRGSTAIGKYIISENAGGTSANCPFALCFIDSGIGAGTYTYTTKANQGSGSFTYGETGNGQAPTILAVELI
jgi:hypothetical protein